jgi:hypothetical protein
VVKTVKNRWKWPKLGLKSTEGWLKLSKIDKYGLNRPETARRVIKSVKNRQIWPKIGLKQPEGSSKVSKIDKYGLK